MLSIIQSMGINLKDVKNKIQRNNTSINLTLTQNLEHYPNK